MGRESSFVREVSLFAGKLTSTEKAVLPSSRESHDIGIDKETHEYFCHKGCGARASSYAKFNRQPCLPKARSKIKVSDFGTDLDKSKIGWDIW